MLHLIRRLTLPACSMLPVIRLLTDSTDKELSGVLHWANVHL